MFVFDLYTNLTFFCFSFKMIGLAQGPRPCEHRCNIVLTSDAKFSFNDNLIYLLSVFSSCCLLFNKKEVLRFEGPLKALAHISSSAWSQ